MAVSAAGIWTMSLISPATFIVYTANDFYTPAGNRTRDFGARRVYAYFSLWHCWPISRALYIKAVVVGV